jgi:hypothetical protein
MNTHPRTRRRRFVTAAILLCALTLLAACGSSSSDKTAPASNADQARKFAQCIRDNGVPDFPDPDANWQFRGAGHEQQDNPKFGAAMEACRNLAPGGTHEQNIGSPAFVEQARKFAKCMRANGVPDFPDPGPDGTFSGAGHELQGDPKSQAAYQACQSKLPNGGDHQ